MGRPLNKKYFGNRNLGTTGTGDDGLGGKIVASVTLGTLGSYTTRPVPTFSDPDKLALGAVRATGTVTSEALSAVATVAGTNYVVGDLLTVTTAGGSAIAYVASVDTGGEVLTVNFTGTGASRGSFAALPTGAQATTDNSVAGDGCTLTITFRAKAVVITNTGSGYTDATDAAVTFTESVTGTTVLGAYSAPGNNEPAIIITAWIPTVDGGSSSVVGDIVAQKGSRRMRVETAQGTGTVTLVADTVAAGQGTIIATDANGSTYWVTKLTSRKALLTRKTMSSSYLFESNTTAQWSFATAAGSVVQIANA